MLNKRLADSELSLEVSDEVLDKIASLGYDPVYGARPLKRAIQHLILDPLSMAVLDGRFKDGDTIVADADGDSIAFRAAT